MSSAFHFTTQATRKVGNNNYLHSDITGKIIEAFFKVHNTLGYGFLEKVYERAMVIELRKMGLLVQSQHPVKVYYDDAEVGSYSADLVVENKVIVELKAAEALHEANEYQLVNYLKATATEVGLLLNFGPEPQFRRKVFSNDCKTSFNSERLAS